MAFALPDSIQGLEPGPQDPSLAAKSRVQGVHHCDGQAQDPALKIRLPVFQGGPVQIQHQVYRVLVEQLFQAMAPADQDLQGPGKV